MTPKQKAERLESHKRKMAAKHARRHLSSIVIKKGDKPFVYPENRKK